MNREPTACLTMDIAGLGENPAIRSGPYAAMVCTWAAATISAASSQPDLDQSALAAGRRVAPAPFGVAWTSAHASTGSPSRVRASRYISISTPRA